MPRWLHKRGMVWHYRFNAGGRDYSGSTGATDLATAKLVLDEARTQAILLGIGKGKAPTLGAVVSEWLKGRAAGRHKSAAEKNIEILATMAKMPADRITTPVVQEWAVRWMADHTTASVNHVLRYLKLWLRYALAEKLIREMPCKVPLYKEQERPRPVVGVDLLDTVCVKAKNPQIRAALALCLMSGMREGELLQARWEWLQGDTLVIQGKTKSKRIRSIPLPPRALQELRTFAGDELPRLGLMFPGKNGKPHSKGWLRQALGRAGVDGLGMHRLRASFATWLLRNKANPKDVQEMLGHRYIVTTMKYAEGSLEAKRKAQDELWA